jgi:hypothetical protein
VFVKNEGGGFTPQTQRVLACGSLPIAVGNNNDKNDESKKGSHSVYYAKWLRRNVHYLDASSDLMFSGSEPSTSSMNMTYCSKLEKIVSWARTMEGTAVAKNVGLRARRFVSTILGPRLLHEYLLALFSEVQKSSEYVCIASLFVIH